MAADPGIRKPGKKYGPCKVECPHRDCAESRRIATVCTCRLCDKTIGWETRFYIDPDDPPGVLVLPNYVHADCLEDLVHGTRLARKEA